MTAAKQVSAEDATMLDVEVRDIVFELRKKQYTTQYWQNTRITRIDIQDNNNSTTK